MKVNLRNKVAIITGAAGSIGSETSRILAKNGARILINDLNEELGNKLAEEITNQGHEALFLKGDVTSEQDIIDLVNTAENKYGSVDILVNNAGVNVGNDKRKALYDYDPEAWDWVVNVCLDSVYYCCKHILPIMVRQRHGKIVNIGSVAGWLVPLRMQSPYCAAKAQIMNMTKAMAMQYGGQGVSVNAVVPGSIFNEQIKAAVYGSDDRSKRMLAHIPKGYTGAPVEIANAVLYLVADESDYLSGTAINVDGGWTAGYAFNAKRL